jgi:hypothetical protein
MACMVDGGPQEARSLVPTGVVLSRPAVVYAQPIRFDPAGYGTYAESLLNALCAQFGAQRLHVVLWPEVEAGHVHVWTGEDYLSRPGALLSGLARGRGSIDPRGFGDGLRECCAVARKANADIVIVAHNVAFLWDSGDGKDMALLRELSASHRIHLVLYGEPGGPLADALSGYAVLVTPGNVPYAGQSPK